MKLIFNGDKVTLVNVSSDATMFSSNEHTMGGQNKFLKQAIPLLLLILVNFIYQKTIYIILFLSLLLVFDSSNNFIVKHHILQNHRSIWKTLGLFAFLGLNIVLLIPFAKDYWLFNLLNFGEWFHSSTGFWEILFTITVFDFVLKLFTICMKCLILIPSFSILQPSKRGGLFEAIESISQFIRYFLPIPEWLKYAFATSTGSVPLLLAWLFSIFYVVFKIASLKSKGQLISKVFSTIRYPEVIGIPILNENIQDEKGVCPICHQCFNNPTQLPCQHVFCRGCCQLWFNQDISCPVCSSDSLASVVMGQLTRLPSSIPLTTKKACWQTGTSEFIIQLF